MLDISIKVVAYLFVVSEVIQGDLGEGQKAGDLLENKVKTVLSLLTRFSLKRSLH